MEQTEDSLLSSQIKRLRARAFEKMLLDNGIDDGDGVQGRILHELWERGRLTISDIGRLTSLDNTSLTGTLDQMETAGLVVRTPDTGNPRQIFIELAGQVREYREACDQVSRGMQERSGQGYTEEEIEGFKRQLRRILPDKQELIRLVEGCRDAVVCSVDKEGFPNAKAMFQRANDGIETFWFSSNNSALRTARWLENPKSCVYFVNPDTIRGLMLTGTMEVMTDNETRRRYWNEGDEKYYPLGPTDPDYCMLRFTAQTGNYYYGMGKWVFAIGELED